MTSEHRLDPLLKPASIALIGASDRADRPGGILADLVIRSPYRGNVYAVNPRCEQILGQRCYPDLESLPERVDHAVIALGTGLLEETLQVCARQGVRAATIYSNVVRDGDPGFKARLVEIASAAGIQICGANGMGFYNPPHGLYAGIFPRPAELEVGGISYIAQSGSAFSALCHNGFRLGFNICVSSGNEMTTTVADYMDWSLQQDGTRVIALFLETVRDPRGFVAALEKAREREVPVVVLKIGRSALAVEMAKTHTGAIAGEYAAFRALCRRHAVIEVDDFDEMAAMLMLLQSGRTVTCSGFAACFESGGFRELITDLADDVGIEFAALEPGTKTALAQQLDDGLEAENPLDAWGTHDNFEARFAACMQLLMADPQVGGGAFFSNFRDRYYLSEAIYDAVAAAHAAVDKPVALINCYADLDDEQICRRAQAAGIPMIDGVREGLLAFKRLFDYHAALERGGVDRSDLPDAATWKQWQAQLRAAPGPVIAEAEALALLASAGVTAPAFARVADREALRAAAARIGYPLVLKTAEAGIDHKSDSRGVHVGLADEAALLAAYDDLAARLGPQALVAQMVEPGVEIGLGIKNDAQFGPMILIAAGGILIELLDDRALALCPLDRPAAERLLASLRSDRLLHGVRGGAAVERDALLDVIVNLSRFAATLGDDIAEIDINPVIVNTRGAFAVDALILRQPDTVPERD